MAMLSEQKLAVLIDADNATAKNLKPIIDEVTKYGVPTIKHAYGDWAKLGGWKDALLEIGAVPVQQYAYTTGKNATDSALIIEAMDILHENNVDGFVIVSSDSDFTALAAKIREGGKSVYGMGGSKTPRSFRTACTDFFEISIAKKPATANGQNTPHATCPRCGGQLVASRTKSNQKWSLRIVSLSARHVVNIMISIAPMIAKVILNPVATLDSAVLSFMVSLLN